MQTSTHERLSQYFTTDRQRAFMTDFRAGAAEYEVWDEVVVGQSWDAQNTFEVTEDDIVAFNQGVAETHPLFVDPVYAKEHSPTGVVLDHPLFSVLVTFYCIGTGPGNWIRSPGARNPGQVMEFCEPFRVGEVISDRITALDKWVRRDKHYLTYRHELTSADGVRKGVWDVTLILPPDRAGIASFAAD